MIKRTINIHKLRWILAFSVVLFAMLSCDEPTTPRPPSEWEKYWTVYYGSFSWLTQVVFVSENEAWMIKEDKLVHYLNGQFIEVQLPESQYQSEYDEIARISFCDPSHGWAVLWFGAIYKYENGIWSEIQPFDSSADEVMCNDIHALSESDIWISGVYFIEAEWSWHSCLWHFDGTIWERTNMPLPEADKLYFKSANDGYLTYESIDNGGGVYHWDGQDWSEVQLGNAPCGVGFDNNGNVFVASICSRVWSHYGIQKIVNGNLLGLDVESSYLMQFIDIQSNSKGDIWAVGQKRIDTYPDLIAHWNGQDWYYIIMYPGDLLFQSVAVTEGGEVWATFRVGDGEAQRSYLAKLNVSVP